MKSKRSNLQKAVTKLNTHGVGLLWSAFVLVELKEQTSCFFTVKTIAKLTCQKAREINQVTATLARDSDCYFSHFLPLLPCVKEISFFSHPLRAIIHFLHRKLHKLSLQSRKKCTNAPKGVTILHCDKVGKVILRPGHTYCHTYINSNFVVNGHF